MIYLDYSATTPVSKHVLKGFYEYSQLNFANGNSIHALGQNVLKDINETTQTIKDCLGLPDYDITYTSGSTESNNLALKGVAFNHLTKGKHIITSPFEHGSITASLNYLAKEGFIIDVVEIDDSGLVDLDDLENLICPETILVSIGLVNSELGIVQDIEKISRLLKKHPNIIFHSDMTQGIGKIKLDYSYADLISFSGHKIYGFKGIGALLHRKAIALKTLIHGGQSISQYRGGTPMNSLIHSLGSAIKLAYGKVDEHYEYIKELNQSLRLGLEAIESCYINSNEFSIPHILNVSFIKTTGHKLQKYLSDRDIYLSTTSACSSSKPMSRVVKEVTNDELRAQSAIRISLSHLTEKKDLDQLIEVLVAYDKSN